MTRAEEAIIRGFLMGAHKAVKDAEAQSPEKLASAKSAYDVLCRLAKQLKVDNPCEK